MAVSYGGKPVFKDSLSEALNAVFGVDGAEPPPETTPPPGDGDTTTPPATGDAALKDAIADAQKAYTDGEAALEKQDWEAYGKAQEDLQDALARAAAAEKSAETPAKPPAGGSDDKS